MFRIAIAEDDEDCARQLQEYLERYGRENGEELEIRWFPDGMELAEEYRPVYDLLLLDIEMPHLDGMTAPVKSAVWTARCSFSSSQTWPSTPSAATRWRLWALCSSR